MNRFFSKKQKSKVKKVIKPAKAGSSNPYLHKIVKLRKTIPHWDNLYSPSVSSEDRINALVRLDVLGTQLCEKYSWAIPDNRALRILQEFSPLVEIGCGKAYWAKLLRDMNVDIVAVDKYASIKSSWTQIIRGEPKVLQRNDMKHRNLFLCYPDENESMGSECLKYYQGKYIIHIGESLMTGGTRSGPPQAPFGRTTGSDFQVQLAESFHCLLVANLPRYPLSMDTISVWKRTSFVEGLNHDNDDDDEKVDSRELDEESDHCSESTQALNLWASMPDEEILPTERVAPCLAHLLS
jgi:hypothetical protein